MEMSESFFSTTLPPSDQEEGLAVSVHRVADHRVLVARCNLSPLLHGRLSSSSLFIEVEEEPETDYHKQARVYLQNRLTFAMGIVRPPEDTEA